MTYTWLFAGLACSLCWGVGNFIRRTISNVPPTSLAMTYSAWLFASNLLIDQYNNNTASYTTLPLAQMSIYCLLFTAASMINMYAVKVDPESSFKMHIISGTYTLITALLCYFIKGDQMNIVKLLIGFGLISAGCAFVASA